MTRALERDELGASYILPIGALPPIAISPNPNESDDSDARSMIPPSHFHLKSQSSTVVRLRAENGADIIFIANVLVLVIFGMCDRPSEGPFMAKHSGPIHPGLSSTLPWAPIVLSLSWKGLVLALQIRKGLCRRFQADTSHSTHNTIRSTKANATYH
ncbi:hypothetical protein BD779DRAFT_1474064 [Infundibulicybe gibba]|nr:hypothetical protein BD779DRAFT_1474064 [Infundibulicybe gibba]